jgi:hypothetical protein
MYYKLNDVEIRGICKERLESLEYWLRRIIDETLSKKFGDYINYSDEHGNKLIKSEFAKFLLARKANEPERYPRLVDAILLDDAINIICNPNLYRNHFAEILNTAFPDGQMEARTFMMRLVPARNALSHANPISIRQAEQIICYSNDIIDSIKKYYTEKNMDNEYNVPLILKVTDSFGNVFYRNQMGGVHDGGIMMNFLDNPRYNLRVGDTISLEIEVDPSFDEDEYIISWSSTKNFGEPRPEGKKAVIKITEKQVSQQFDVQCNIKSNKGWHRMHNGSDDFMLFYYKVLPPI